MTNPKQSCVNCHFLAIRHAEPNRLFGLEPEQTAAVKRDDFSFLPNYAVLSCAMEVWDEGYQGEPLNRHQNLVERDRNLLLLPSPPGDDVPRCSGPAAARAGGARDA
jgi:hypothetical protein